MNEVEKILSVDNLCNSYWGRRIISAEKRRTFTQTDRMRACKWVTCACGKVRPQLDVCAPQAAPKDEVIRQFGYQFADLIEGNNFENAARCLVKIELRAKELANG